ncbi:MAG: hypothetical protein NC418_11085 [Muribaculaceae bacterium]|nr:hypothetical protein [Muribaculaceae bacterium]
MNHIHSLIHLNIELEGLLRVLADRQSAEVKAMLAEKFRQYSALMDDLLAVSDEPAEAPVQEAPVPDVEALAEVKMQEAEEPEVVPEIQASEKAVAQEQAIDPQPKPQPQRKAHPGSLMRSFTLNDKFRFIRDIFGGDEADFADTVALIEDMSSYKDAADYLVEDLMLNPDDENVADFLDFVARYF